MKAMSVGGEQPSLLSTLQCWAQWRRWHLMCGRLNCNSPTRASELKFPELFSLLC